MIRAGLRLLSILHARGYHAAVLAALIVMPTVTAVGFLTRDPDRAPAQDGSARLRPSFNENR